MSGSTETIARAFNLHRAGREFTGKCPNCGYPSGFAVTERDGVLLYYCHARGCSQLHLQGALERAGLLPRRSRQRRVERRRQSTRGKSVPKSTELLGHPVSTLSNSDPKREQAALTIWRRSRPADGTTAETYLRSRGYPGPIPPTLRFASGKHPSDPDQYHPMMVGAVVCDDHIVAIHRTFLRPDGRGKADLDPNKMTIGRCKGAAVRLAPAGPILALAEGIETALSYMQVRGLPTWAALSAGGFRSLILPEEVREIIIAADSDPVGLIAARAAARLWLAEGRQVSIARPPLGVDFNDLVRAGL